MTNLWLRSTCAVVFIFICTSGSFGQKKASRALAQGERLITALAHSRDVPAFFRDDDGIFGITGREDGKSPELERILRLGKHAIPLLIRHLDDYRYTHMSICCTGPGLMERATVADASLSILTRIIRPTSPVYDAKCLRQHKQFDETDEDCMAERFFPGKNMKRNWERAYRAGKIHYMKVEY